ncbi:hypothetical protein EON83_28545 [bacterium]|nr:MAG: hypothetical protein EON83_28545 [bacterium]
MTHSPVSSSSSSASSPLYPKLSQREIKWGQGLLLAFILLVSLPYLWCALITPPGFTWGGLFFSADDQNVHLMWARQAQNGSLFIRDLFTTEGLVSGDRPLFFNLFTLALGLTARITTIDTMFLYHIARVAFAGLFVWQLHRLLIAATGGSPEHENTRLGALALATLTTGGGFIVVLLPFLSRKIVLLDHATKSSFVAVPEAFALLSALIYPLNIASFALLCFLLRAIIENRGPVKAFFAALILSNIHTYDALPLLVMCLVGVCWMAYKHENLKSKLAVWSAIFVGSLIPILYQALVFRGSEEFRIKALTPTSPPAIYHLIPTYAPLVILAIWALYKNRGAGKTKGWTPETSKWLFIYAISLLVLIYLPKSPSLIFSALFSRHATNANLYLLSFSRKMLEGLQIPLLVFAGAGLALLPHRKYTVPAVIAVCSLSPITFWSWTISNATENNATRVQAFLMPPYYLSNADAGALLALQKVPDKNQAVLCLPLIGSYVPRATGLFTYVGHWAETLHLERKLGQEMRFYRGRMTPTEARAFLKDNHIGYIIESPYERNLAPNSSFARSLGLKSIYSANSPDGETIVFQVND